MPAAGPLPRRANSGRALLAWLPTLAWLLVLSWFSSDTFSAEHTGRILKWVMHAIYGPVSRQAFAEIHFLVRKSAHFFSYGLLSALAFFAWRATFALRRLWSLRCMALALALTLLAAGLDEFHQSFVASRTSSPRDVALDMFGALCFQLVIAAWTRSRKPEPQ